MPETPKERFRAIHPSIDERVPKFRPLEAFLQQTLQAPTVCYKTTGKLTQQLKNKFGQAAAKVHGGLLLLSLPPDEHDNALLALHERWSQNDEWGKDAACVGLAAELESGWTIRSIVEWMKSSIPARIAEPDFFPDVRVLQALGSPAAGGPGMEETHPPFKPATALGSLNRIYFGPPGTGKTFTTAAKAVEIVDGKVSNDRHEVMRRYSQLRETNHIAFVTFHQSFSYEEFVEGIRPALSTGSPDSVEYECATGVFRSICESAMEGGAADEEDVDFGDARFWKLSLGNTKLADDSYVFDDAIKDGVALLGYGGTVDYSGARDRAAVLQSWRQHAPNDETEYAAQAIDRFKNEMRRGDYVVVTDGNRKFRAIGRVAGPYELTARSRYAQSRPMEWLFVPEESRPYDQISRKAFSQATFYELKPAHLKLDAIANLVSKDKAPARNHVLIIDEINRGNVAKIFGELITLLEPDKRLGQPNEVRVRLPYSQEEFGVPANVYVIGTMNTADRSIAFLDTALRRRFEFEELMPDPSVLRRELPNEGKLGEVPNLVDIPSLLQLMNERIEVLFDRDHTLGHAYFLGIQELSDLRRAFQWKVIPLLQDYFYDDWDKITLVLGCSTADNNPSPLLLAKKLNASTLLPGGDGYEDKVRYELNPAFLDASESQLASFFNGIALAAQPQ